tara:strand:+ start:307 stop:1401 length:1095 start_codon:yes stop_codon:yes gene_type:complete
MELQKTVLSEDHIKLEAKMAAFAGFSMPIQYTSVKNEVTSVREKVGIFDVSHMGEFLVTGSEAAKFVDFLITNDFFEVEDYKAVYSPLCREDGTVIDDLIAYKISNDEVLICVNSSNIKKDWDWISNQAQKFDVTLTDQSNDYSLLAIQGPNAPELLIKLGIMKKDEIEQNTFPYYSIKRVSLEGNQIIVARTGYTGEDGFEVFSPSPEMTKRLWSQAIENGGTPCGLAARDVLRLEVCYPLYGHELADNITPLDASLKWTVKNKKPSFIGKDFLASYEPKYKLVKLALEKGIPREGYNILNSNEEIIGKVTSGTLSVMLNKGISLGLVEKEKFPKDKRFFIQIRKNIFEATYQTKPFFKGGHK